MREEIEKMIHDAIAKLQGECAWEKFDIPKIEVQYPPNDISGDFTTNIALVLSSRLKKNPMEIAKQVVERLELDTLMESIKVAAPGYINMDLKKEVLFGELNKVLDQGGAYGRNDTFSGKKVIVEYTDPNPFKVLHIGHLMTNIIGEAIARLYDFSGAEVKRAVYQGDVGMHVGKTLWGVLQMKEEVPSEDVNAQEYVQFLGRAYVKGNSAYEDDEKARAEIRVVNQQVYERSNEEVNVYYDIGRKKSLEYFEVIYEKLGTKFDYYFFESQTAPIGKQIVEENIENGIFKKSEGAVVFAGEEYGLHTRVFLNKENLPTYEAKDLGLGKLKYETYPHDLSVIVTANEQKAYFEVVLQAFGLLYPEIAKKTQHVDHGMLRFASGKMSSRKGNVITGESLLEDTIQAAHTKVQSEDIESEQMRQDIATKVGVGALKYSILKQSIGRDIVFDMESSLAIEGSSGPYLQYTFVRTNSVLKKAFALGLEPSVVEVGDIGDIERVLRRFPEVVQLACQERSPHYLCEYLFSLSQMFNAYYANNQIIQEDDKDRTLYRLALTHAVGQVLKNGLNILGIKVPERM